MSILDSPSAALTIIIEDPLFDEAQVAAAAFLARYSGRTLDAYRYDLRTFCSGPRIPMWQFSRPHAPTSSSTAPRWNKGISRSSTIDRRLSTVCGFYRFAHIDGRIGANPAQYVRRPKVHPSEGRGLDRGELGHVPLHRRAVRPRPRRPRRAARAEWPTGQRGLWDQHRGPCLRARPPDPQDHRQRKQAGGHPPGSGAARTIDLVSGSAQRVRSFDDRTASASTGAPHTAGFASIGKRAGLGIVHPHMLRAAFIMAALDAGVPLRDVQIAARHADPRTTTIYDRRRENFDRHAAYVVVAFVAGG